LITDYHLVFGGNSDPAQSSIPRFVPLPGITSLWNPQDRKTVVKGGTTNPASLIAFSGGGSSISFQVEDADDSNMDMGSTSVSKTQGTGFGGESLLGAGGFAIHGSGENSYEVSTSFNQGVTRSRSKATSASFTLLDEDEGDEFVVKVYRDSECEFMYLVWVCNILQCRSTGKEIGYKCMTLKASNSYLSPTKISE
jgi:hypothetical protein